MSFGLKQPATVALDPQGGEPPAAIGPGVNPDSVIALINLFGNRVTMYHELAVASAVGEERPANPEHILGFLEVEGPTGANACVHEKVVALFM